MLEITEQNYDEVIGKTNLPVVLDFGATWCGPCQVIKPYIEKMGNTYEGKAIVAKVDIDEAGDLPMKFGIRNVPTVIYLKDGKVVEVAGFSQAKSRNLAQAAAQNSAANRYATSASQQVKGRVLADMALDVANQEAEFDKFYAAFEGKVQQEIKGELRPSFAVAKQNADGTISVEAYFLVDDDAASRARINAFKNSQTESAVAQKYAQKISNFVNERVVPEQ